MKAADDLLKMEKKNAKAEKELLLSEVMPKPSIKLKITTKDEISKYREQ